MEQLISKPEAVNVIRGTKGGFFGIEFVKKDGSRRTMLARTGAHRKTKGGDNTVAHLPRYITVWDRHKRGFRNINVNTIQYLTFNGNRYMVA